MSNNRGSWSSTGKRFSRISSSVPVTGGWLILSAKQYYWRDESRRIWRRYPPGLRLPATGDDRGRTYGEILYLESPGYSSSTSRHCEGGGNETFALFLPGTGDASLSGRWSRSRHVTHPHPCDPAGRSRWVEQIACRRFLRAIALVEQLNLTGENDQRISRSLLSPRHLQPHRPQPSRSTPISGELLMTKARNGGNFICPVRGKARDIENALCSYCAVK